MNAKEFADELEKSPDLWFKDEIAGEWVIATLRQQQAEIESYKNPIMAAIALSFNPLTDEELFNVYADLEEVYTGNNFPVDLGRAILRKALEK